MDANRFDTLLRALTAARSRRGALAAVVGSTLGLLRLAETTAKHRKHKKHKKRSSPLPLPLPPPPPPPLPTCSDGIRNGSESDIDCGGGTCPRCAATKTCASRNDCISALCTGTTCRACIVNDDCGTDANPTPCKCNETNRGEMVCTTYSGGTVVDDCSQCPVGTNCLPKIVQGLLFCIKPCGAP